MEWKYGRRSKVIREVIEDKKQSQKIRRCIITRRGEMKYAERLQARKQKARGFGRIAYYTAGNTKQPKQYPFPKPVLDVLQIVEIEVTD